MPTPTNADPPKRTRAFVKGLGTGFILQLAIGPVFFYIVNLVLRKSIYDGIAAVFAVTLVDYLYIALSTAGIRKLLPNTAHRKTIGIVSSLVLIIFGAVIMHDALRGSFNTPAMMHTGSVLTSFLSVCLLTLSNPLTIIFFSGLFAARTVEDHFSPKELYIFGAAVGLATFIFMSLSVLVFSLLKETMPVEVIQMLNVLVGVVLIAYGSIRAIKVLKKRRHVST